MKKTQKKPIKKINKNKFVIMTIGRTHSGKTTFGEELKKKFRGSALIQTDIIAEFLTQHFPKRMYRGDEANGNFNKPALKLSLFNTIIQHALNIKQKNIIFANSNLYRDFRKEHIDNFKKNGYKVIGVYLNYHGKVLKSRIKNSNRDNSLLKTKNFEKLVDIQRKILQKPKEDEFDFFYEVKNNEDLDSVKNKIIKKVTRK